jgi:hypothetical protein
LKKRPSKSLGFLHENVVEKTFFNTLLEAKAGLLACYGRGQKAEVKMLKLSQF